MPADLNDAHFGLETTTVEALAAKGKADVGYRANYVG